MAYADDANISIASSDGKNDDVVPRFTIDSETNRQYSRFNARGTELTVRLLPPAVGDNSDAITHFHASVNGLFDYALRNSEDSDMVGITIHNEVNLLDKTSGISFRRKDQLTEEGIWSVFSKGAQSNAWYNALDRMIVVIHSVKIPIGFGRKALKTMGRPLSVTAHLKRSIIKVKAKTNCLAHALIIAIARLMIQITYRTGRGVRYFQRYSVYCRQRESICVTAGGSVEYNSSKSTFENTKLSCTVG
jgi:hypothetical protein